MVDIGIELTPEALARTQATYKDALDALKGHHRAVEARVKQALVGRYFAHTEALRDDASVTWRVYIAVTDFDAEQGHLLGWHFQRVPTGQIEMATDDDLQPQFLAEQCVDVERNVFVAAFNELLTETARYATRMPA
jgi:hypothetical protein